MRDFIEAVSGDDTFKPSTLDLKLTREDALARLSVAYGL
jgi:hypothetical protein